MKSISDIFAKTYETQEGLCFVVMPFSENLSEIYERVLKPSVTSEPLLMRCIRGDEVYTDKPIMGDVWEFIQKAEIVIADLTGRNPNVLYELGLCHALWKKVVMIAQSIEDLPFDLRHFRAIIYKHTLRGADELRENLVSAIMELRALPSASEGVEFLRDDPDSLKEFDGIRVIAKKDALSPTRIVIRRAHTTQIKYPTITISVSTINVTEDGETEFSIGYIMAGSRIPESLKIKLYPSQYITIRNTRSVQLFYLTLNAIDSERKSALIDIVPLPAAEEGEESSASS